MLKAAMVIQAHMLGFVVRYASQRSPPPLLLTGGSLSVVPPAGSSTGSCYTASWSSRRTTAPSTGGGSSCFSAGRRSPSRNGPVVRSPVVHTGDSGKRGGGAWRRRSAAGGRWRKRWRGEVAETPQEVLCCVSSCLLDELTASLCLSAGRDRSCRQRDSPQRLVQHLRQPSRLFCMNKSSI